MNSVNAIELIIKEYHEIEWLASNKSFSLGTNYGGYYVQINDRTRMILENDSPKKRLLINKFSKASIDDFDKLKDYIVLTEITSKVKVNNIEITKNSKKEEFEEGIKEDKKYFSIKQDFFICHIIKVTENDFLEQVQKVIAFKTLDEFRDNLTISIDNWDDYGYQTVLKLSIWKENFYLRVNPRNPEMIDYLKGESEEKPGTDNHNNSYYCSLGDEAYYNFFK